MPKLYVMVGIPGSGKSTWAKNNLPETVKYVSRDEIRLKYVKDSTEYFRYESIVMAEFISQIENYLLHNYDVCADATHITYSSRRKLINSIITDAEIIFVVMNTPLELCLARNDERTGLACVPEMVIENMHKNFQMPKEHELGCSKIIKIEV